MTAHPDMPKLFNKFFNSPFFARGFRPFFMLGAFYSAFMITAWVFIFNGNFNAPAIWSDPILWHGHEMIYGFVMAIIAGFLLTAVPNWTGQPPVSKVPLALLTLVWILGRLSFWSSFASPLILAIIDLSFIPLLAISLSFALIRSGNKRNFMFLALLTLLLLGNLFMHLSALKIISLNAYNASYMAIMLVMMIISIVGGRVIPAFTVGSLRMQGVDVTQKDQSKLDITGLVLILGIIISIFMIDESSYITGVFAILAALAHLWRMSFWHSLKTYKDPLLWILHLGHFWLIAGLFTFGLYNFDIIEVKSLPIHILTIGSIGSTIIGMIARVSLGHTGRPLTIGKTIVLSFIMIQAATIIRVLAIILKDENYSLWVMGAGLLWSGAFVIYLLFYTKILISLRPDGMAA